MTDFSYMYAVLQVSMTVLGSAEMEELVSI